METYFYKCPICGFIHLVPIHERSVLPQEEIRLEHFNLKQGEVCFCRVLKLLRED